MGPENRIDPNAFTLFLGDTPIARGEIKLAEITVTADTPGPETIRRRGNRRTRRQLRTGSKPGIYRGGLNMKKAIELFKVRSGETFTLDGVEFVKLSEDLGAALVLTRDVVMKNVPFEDEDAEREDHNNYIGSNLEKQCVRWLRDEHPAIFETAVERPIDLTTMDGMTDYGMPLAMVRTLTIDEYRKYRRFIPLASEPYWLATGWTTASSPCSDTGLAYRISADGNVYNYNVYAARFAPRPALYLKSSILVSVDDGEEKGMLGSYTELELLAELQRRVKK